MTVGYSPRQLEILTLLAKYGVLGSVPIRKLLMEDVSKICLRHSLRGMEQRGLVCRYNFAPGGSPMSHWMLPEEGSVQAEVLAATGLERRFLRRKCVRYSHAPHEGLCTLVHASLERQMPKLWIAREATGTFDDIPKHLLSGLAKENGYTPDLCVGVPNERADAASLVNPHRWIAVEVDRTYRSHKRLAQRLNIYTKHTGFSGLLYLMPTVGTRTVLQRIYDVRGGKETLRLHGSANAFLAVGTVPDDLFDVNSMRVWCGEYEISLSGWLSLFSQKNAEARDQSLSEYGYPGIGRES